MKSLVFFLLVAIVAASDATALKSRPNSLLSKAKVSRGLIDDLNNIKECIIADVYPFVQQVIDECAEEIREFEIIVAELEAQMEACYDGYENPSLIEQLEIAKCLAPIYAEINLQVAYLEIRLEQILIQLEVVPGMVGQCF